MALTDADILTISDLIDARLKQPRHESDDHLPRGLDVSKIKPGTTAGTFLHTDGSDCSWRVGAGTHMASMYLANSGSPTHTSFGGWQKVGAGGGTATWTSEYDVRPGGVSAQVDTSTNKRIDIRKAGIYLVTASVHFTSIADAKNYYVAAYKNGSIALANSRTNGVASDGLVPVVGPLLLSAGDYLELYANQGDSGSEAYNTGIATANRLTVTYLGPSS